MSESLFLAHLPMINPQWKSANGETWRGRLRRNDNAFKTHRASVHKLLPSAQASAWVFRIVISRQFIHEVNNSELRWKPLLND